MSLVLRVSSSLILALSYYGLRAGAGESQSLLMDFNSPVFGFYLHAADATQLTGYYS